MEKQEMKLQVRFLESEHLVFRPLEEGDVDAGYRWINDPDTRRYLTVYTPTTFEQERRFMCGEGRDRNEIILAIVEKETGRHIGGIDLRNIHWRDRRAVLGFMIGEQSARGKGYGTEAMRTIIEYAFSTLNLLKVRSMVVGPNIGSIRCHEKCGFKQVGLFKQEVFVDGGWENLVAFEVFSEDWFRQKDQTEK